MPPARDLVLVALAQEGRTVLRITWVLPVAAFLAGEAQGQDKTAVARLSAEGRFLYADDDDWDWATPAGANQPCRLSVYGRMPWSALDWMEDGLPEVRGVLVGTPPALGNYLTMADLNRVRGAGPKRSYEQVQHQANILADLLKDRKPPNLIILMQDTGPPNLTITEADVAAALEFVQRGGRLIILDDWQCYRSLVTPFLNTKTFGPAKPPPAVEPSLRKTVEEKVRLLGASQFRAREMAQADLVKLGRKIVPILEAAQPGTLEEQRRIAAILRVLRPPEPVPAANEGWLTEAVQTARKLHPSCEVRTISRNGQQQPGTALLIRLAGPGKGP
jgi:hypothetical protein